MSSAVRQNTARSRFELDADGETAVASYRLSGGVTHTETAARICAAAASPRGWSKAR
jgi:hypothetical protein